EPPEGWALEDLCAIELGPNDVTFQRLRAGIQAMLKASGPTRTLRDRVLGIADAPPPARVKAADRAGMNDVQSQALSNIAAEPPLFLLHGPPGTGKTTVLAAAIAEATAQGRRVLGGAPSNQAVDNLAHALLGLSIDIVRLGHPSRVDPALYAHTLEGKLETHPQRSVAEDLFKQARKLFREASQKKLQGRALDAREQAFQLRKEARTLLDEARQMEQRALEHVLSSTPVVLATLTGLRDDLLGEMRFDLGVVDEATQAVVPALFPLLARSERMLMAGDHRQLGP